MTEKNFEMRYFPVNIATEYSLNEAILLMHICYWVTINSITKKNYHMGRHWTYDSAKSLATKHPYFSESTVKRTLKALTDHDLILKGTFNKAKYDRTNWYTLTPKSENLLEPVIQNIKNRDYSGNVTSEYVDVDDEY